MGWKFADSDWQLMLWYDDSAVVFILNLDASVKYDAYYV